MSIKYSLALMSTKPGDDTAKKMYYAKAQADGVVTMDEMAEEISYATSLTDGDVLNVLRALIRQMKVQLAAGKIVKMENFGTFQIQVCSTGTETKKEFTANNITAAPSRQDGEGSHTFGGVELHESDREERKHSR